MSCQKCVGALPAAGLSRRAVLGRFGLGLGGMALANLVNPMPVLGSTLTAADRGVLGGQLHFPATAKRPAGVTATVLLAESHVCLHTWPAERAVTCDVYVCNSSGDRSARARGLMLALVDRFQPEWTEQRSLDRGEEE